MEAYASHNAYVGRVYLNSQQYNLLDYIWGHDSAMKEITEGRDICIKSFNTMKGDIQSNQNLIQSKLQLDSSYEQ